ncbi:uncharacterized protein LOC126156388 [Schistocerca cancellata]|uniref:uncharacterized protein LOC126156388 n=1 Tax=Schistocerca cancellata TaxID=274614 RepID=UPI002118D44E|nr:uncharacterized protein LOC126156388 [Schistocerca cancellata]
MSLNDSEPSGSAKKKKQPHPATYIDSFKTGATHRRIYAYYSRNEHPTSNYLLCCWSGDVKEGIIACTVLNETTRRSEVCRLEQDVLGLRDLLSRREESWRRAKARELEARKKIASLSTELATVRQLAQMRRNQSDELAHRLQEALLELKKHKVENDKLRNNVVRLRNRERSLLTTLTKKCKKSSAKAEHKKGRQQRKKSVKSSLQPESVISSPRGETSPRGILRVQCCPPSRT